MRALVFAGALLYACGGSPHSAPVTDAPPDGGSPPQPASDGGSPAPVQGTRWAAYYGGAAGMGDLATVGATFSLLDLDVDPATGNFTRPQVELIRGGGAKVIAYLDLGSCENYRTWWTSAPNGLVPCAQNTKAWRGTYAGYPSEVWMDLADRDWQDLVIGYIAPVLAEMGVDGFFLDNLEMVEHGTQTTNGPCDAACSQGGLDLVRRLREKYPDKLIVMQNATSDVTRLGVTGGVAFSSLLDGISHEEVFNPQDLVAQRQLAAWRDMKLTPRGQPFWIATEDYVGGCANVAAAQSVFAQSRAAGFHPYASDKSAGQQSVCYWPF